MSELKRGLHTGLESSEGKEQSENHLEEAHERETTRGRFRRARRGRRRRRRLTLAVLPTLLTLGNGVCGLAAIAVAMSVNLPWDNETKLLVAGILIFGGILFDALDGSAARELIQQLPVERTDAVRVLIGC